MGQTLFPADFHIERECLAFSLNLEVDGKIRTVKVLITPMAAKRRFGAQSDSQQDIERSITLEIPAIRALVKSLIELGRESANGEVLIDSGDVMRVTISEKLHRWSEGELLVRQATRRLEEVIGSAAPRVSVAWDCDTDSMGQAVVKLQLADPPDSVSAQFKARDLRADTDYSQLELILVRLWGSILKKQSHQLLSEMMSAAK